MLSNSNEKGGEIEHNNGDKGAMDEGYPPLQQRSTEEMRQVNEEIRHQKMGRQAQEARLRANRIRFVPLYDENDEDNDLIDNRVDPYKGLPNAPLNFVPRGGFRPIGPDDNIKELMMRLEIFDCYEGVFVRKRDVLPMAPDGPIWYSKDVSPLDYWSLGELEFAQVRVTPCDCRGAEPTITSACKGTCNGSGLAAEALVKKMAEKLRLIIVEIHPQSDDAEEEDDDEEDEGGEEGEEDDEEI